MGTKSKSKEKTKAKKAVVLYSGGLDSRLAVKILQEQDFEVTALYFKLPFSCACNLDNFPEKEKVKLEIIDCTKGRLFEEYLKILKNPKHGTGSGINPCKDCKIFIFKKAREYADYNSILVIATGEVLGERPMSQTRHALELIDRKLGFEILRPLSAKLMKETSWEKSGLVKREKLYDIKGRRRLEQIKLTEKFKIRFPSPTGGCLLCEKTLSKRFEFLLENNLVTEKNLPLVSIGRHFFIKEWFVVGRNEKENIIIENFNSIKSGKGKPAVYFEKEKEQAEALQKAYETRNPQEFEKFKI